MGGWKCACVLASVFISFGLADRVPVLVWGSKKYEDDQDDHSALESVTSDGLYHHVKKMAGSGQVSLVMVFLEENLSLEDFSWRGTEGEISFPRLQSVSTSSQFTKFFTSVHAPLKGLKNFQKDGYNFHHIDLKEKYSEAVENLPTGKKTVLVLELDDAKSTEGRPHFLRRHDGLISEMYTELVKRGFEVTAVYTGRRSSWVEPETSSRQRRARRLLADGNNSTVAGTLWMTNDSSVLVYSKSVPYIERGSVQVYNFSEAFQVSSVVNDSIQHMEISFPGNVSLAIQFPLSGGYWSLKPITLQFEDETFELKTYPEIVAPLNFSYHCSQDVVFANSSTNISIVFESLQVQPFLSEASFGDTYDCVWFFTSAIWGGLFVTLLLGSILTWGLGMIMSIKTMDQFDDPKGKTIQVTTTE